jgi:hypothetical protein
MAARLLPGTGVRIRRGRRADLGALRGLLGREGEGLERVFRRLVGDLRGDVYVAEDGGGAVVGFVSLVYARSLARGGLSATLDGARVAREPRRPLLEELVTFAEQRARRRGCVRLGAWVDPREADLRAALLARGYRVGELLVTDLTATA